MRERNAARPQGAAPRRSLRRRWRNRAWKRAAQGNWHEALVLQRALVAAAPARVGREDLGDRFRLLRWEMAAGCWREALECVEGIYSRLSGRGLQNGPIAGWVFLARAVAYLQMGAGPRFRKSLALVLRGRGTRRSSFLCGCALRVGATASRLSREAGSPPGVLERRWRRRFGGAEPPGSHAKSECSHPQVPAQRPQERDGERQGERDEQALARALGRAVPHGNGNGIFRWDELPALVEGPPEAVRLRERLDRQECFRTGLVRDGETNGPAGAPRPGDFFLGRWLGLMEGEPGTAVPVWAVPLLARLVDQAVPESDPPARDRMHQALSRLAAQVSEPWARALALESLAEVSLWLGHGGPGDAVALRAAETALAQARADLGLAAGLFQRMGWKERASACERRWMRLAFPAAGSRVSEPQGAIALLPRSDSGVDPAVRHRSSERSVARNPGQETWRRGPNLSWVRQSLLDAGFLSGDSRVLRDLAPALLLAATPLPALILGESGTGKEVIARALHRWSQMRGEFVPIHCGAIPKDLLESELFGHTRGAFTGASIEKPGLIEAADGGSLFLDEIGEMGMEAQMKMLRVLESGEVRRLGDLRARRVRIRLIAATHRDLESAVRDGIFRLDLYHRIRGIVVRLRPLRERRGDIPMLASRFLAEACEGCAPLHLPDASLAALLAHGWPGNVRELRSLLLRSAHLARALGVPSLAPEFLGLPAAENPAPREAFSALEQDPPGGGSALDLPSREVLARGGLDGFLDGLERRLIVHALQESGWNRTRAARSLGGLSRTTLISKMKRLGIGTEEAGPSAES